MSNHKIVKVRYHEAALVFSNDGFNVVTNGPIETTKISQAFAICYAVLTHEHVFEAFRKIIVKDMEIRKKHTEDLRERLQRQKLIDLLSIGLDEGEEDGDGENEQKE